MAKPLSTEEVKQLHDEALKAPSFINHLNDYEIKKINRYAKDRISKMHHKAVGLAAEARMEYPEAYQDDNGMIRYWLERTGADKLIEKEKQLVRMLQGKIEDKILKNELAQQDMKLNRIKKKREAINEGKKINVKRGRKLKKPEIKKRALGYYEKNKAALKKIKAEESEDAMANSICNAIDEETGIKEVYRDPARSIKGWINGY